MGSNYYDMTENMQMLYRGIVESLGQLPERKRVFIFGDDNSEDMDLVIAVANYIALEFIKYSYDHDDPEFSLRHFLKRIDADESEKMFQSRIVRYVMKYKKKELERHPGISSARKYSNIDMDTMNKKLGGYRFTEMNYSEHQNIHDLEIIKAIVENRIISSKKVSNKRFMKMFEQYDRMVENLLDRSHNCDRDMVFSSLAMFTIEWHYAIETLYYVACLMEKEKIKSIDQMALVLICGGVNIESRFGGSVETESRMVKERMCVLDYLFDNEVDSYSKDAMINLIKEIIVIGAQYKECVRDNDGTPYKEWFRKSSTITDWASFFRYYDLFSIWQKKEWTGKRIQNMRYLFGLVTIPKNSYLKNPENRS